MAGTEHQLRMVVVTPLANEEATINDQLRRTLAQLGPNDRIFCILDNVCRDSTRTLIEAYTKVDSRVMLIWAPENRCVVDAYFAGYRAALATGCRWILEMDGGLSHSPEQIPRFISALESGVDFAAGSRFVKGGAYRGRFKRYFLSKGGSVLARVVLRARMKDMCSGFEAFTAPTLKRVLDTGVESRAHFFQTEIRYMLRNVKWVEVPISYESPSESVTGGVVFESLRNLWRLRKQHRFKSSADPIVVPAAS